MAYPQRHGMITCAGKACLFQLNLSFVLSTKLLSSTYICLSFSLSLTHVPTHAQHPPSACSIRQGLPHKPRVHPLRSSLPLPLPLPPFRKDGGGQDLQAGYGHSPPQSPRPVQSHFPQLPLPPLSDSKPLVCRRRCLGRQHDGVARRP